MKQNHYFPVLLAIAGVMTFSMMDVVMKAQSMAMGVYSAMFWRMVVGSALALAIYLPTLKQKPKPISRRGWHLHIARAVLATVMLYLLFFGLTRIPLAQAIGLTFLAPIIALFLARPLLGEHIDSTATLAAILGFGGVLVVVGGEVLSIGPRTDLLGISAVLVFALLYALNLILQRMQALIAEPPEIVFFQNIMVLLLLLAAAPFALVWPANTNEWIGSALAALLAVGSLLLMSRAYRLAEAQRLINIEYTAFIWAAIFGWLVFAEAVSARTLVGTGLIVVGCFIGSRETRNQPPSEAVHRGKT